mmetsp:Transcript_33940/g.89057  ORF Transcript_33940/g.89057 Transcript_33940/m.89057 type:complete len:217 (-) Transcript_33940:345-995(-)
MGAWAPSFSSLLSARSASASAVTRSYSLVYFSISPRMIATSPRVACPRRRLYTASAAAASRVLCLTTHTPSRRCTVRSVGDKLSLSPGSVTASGRVWHSVDTLAAVVGTCSASASKSSPQSAIAATALSSRASSVASDSRMGSRRFCTFEVRFLTKGESASFCFVSSRCDLRDLSVQYIVPMPSSVSAVTTAASSAGSVPDRLTPSHCASSCGISV